MSREIFITEVDKQRLHKLIGREKEFNTGGGAYLDNLELELNRASVMSPQDVPHNVITMNSKVVLKDLDAGEEIILTLVYPEDANLAEDKISVLAPIGTAILGYRVGDVIDWDIPSGTVQLQVMQLLYQPEAAGDFEL